MVHVICQKGLPLCHERFAIGPLRDQEGLLGAAPQALTKGLQNTMPTSSYGLSSLQNVRLSQRLAGLSQRLAARRAFAAKKPRKRPKISPNFSRQGYASDFHSRQSFLTTAAQLASGVRSPQQAPSDCVAFVMLGVRDTRTVCPIRSNARQNYESIAANLSDKSHGSLRPSGLSQHRSNPSWQSLLSI